MTETPPAITALFNRVSGLVGGLEFVLDRLEAKGLLRLPLDDPDVEQLVGRYREIRAELVEIYGA